METFVTIIIPMYNAENFIIRALDSIPVRDDIQVLVIDDCSTDNSYNLVKDYILKSDLEIILYKTNINSGMGVSTNIGYAEADGKWITGLDNDDYLLTDNYNKIIDKLKELDNYDMVYVSNELNNLKTWSDEHRTAIWCYFVKKSFLGSSRMPEVRWAADEYLTKELRSKNPRVYNTKEVVYHYDFPREGSICWNRSHGLEIDPNKL